MQIRIFYSLVSPGIFDNEADDYNESSTKVPLNTSNTKIGVGIHFLRLISYTNLGVIVTVIEFSNGSWYEFSEHLQSKSIF